MPCTACHGGDPTGLTVETAHLNRSTHPVAGGDPKQCQQCHLDDCYAKIEEFDQIAGISEDVIISSAIATPPLAVIKSMPVYATADDPTGLRTAVIILLVTAVLVGFILGAGKILSYQHHHSKGKNIS